MGTRQSAVVCNGFKGKIPLRKRQPFVVVHLTVDQEEKNVMTYRLAKWARRVAGVVCVLAAIACEAGEAPVRLPPPAVEPTTAQAGVQTAVFAGGCFWGVEGVFRHVKGVRTAVSGYAGGTADTASYEKVSTGRTRHAEAVQVTFDPAQVSYGQLLQVFFSVAHDPTQWNRQGPDTGPQYRSAVFAVDARQKETADAYIKQLDQAKAFNRRIVTEVVSLPAFYPAEAYHQDYMARHPMDIYIAQNDAPKLSALKDLFPNLYVGP